MVAVVKDLNPIHKDVLHTGRILAWIFERSVILDFIRIKNHNVCVIAGLQHPAFANFQI